MCVGVGHPPWHGNPTSGHILKECINPGFRRLRTAVLNRVTDKPAGKTADKEDSCVAAEAKEGQRSAGAAKATNLQRGALPQRCQWEHGLQAS